MSELQVVLFLGFILITVLVIFMIAIDREYKCSSFRNYLYNNTPMGDPIPTDTELYVFRYKMGFMVRKITYRDDRDSVVYEVFSKPNSVLGKIKIHYSFNSLGELIRHIILTANSTKPLNTIRNLI